MVDKNQLAAYWLHTNMTGKHQMRGVHMLDLLGSEHDVHQSRGLTINAKSKLGSHGPSYISIK